MNELPPQSQRAALVRTRLALERTLMAWLRTAISMITFGFTLFKAAEYLDELGVRRSQGLFGVRSFALSMICIGLLALLLATLQNLRHARTLRRLDAELPVFTQGSVLTLLFAAAGVFALVGALMSRH
jgi:putative membrane protein